MGSFNTPFHETQIVSIYLFQICKGNYFAYVVCPYHREKVNVEWTFLEPWAGPHSKEVWNGLLLVGEDWERMLTPHIETIVFII